MFKVTTTGKNLHYGKENQIRLLNDGLVVTAIRRGWIKKKVEYIEDGRNSLRIIDISTKCKKCGKELGAD
jgi:hypothetical protein